MRARRRGIVRAMALGLGSAALAVLAVLPSASAKSPDPRVTGPATASGVLTPGGAQLTDASTVHGIKRYLRSLGVDPRGVVVQRGERNYAGPNCPGPRWNCTTATKVVQLSPTRAGSGADDDDDENRFVCKKQRGTGSVVTKDDVPPDLTCFVLQPGGSSNSATCDIRTFGSTGTITQTCFITQGGTSNNAVAKLFAAMGAGGGDQNIRQRIEIKQTGGSRGNTLNASETAALKAGGNAGDGLAASYQDFNQVICGNQTASLGGANVATIKQLGGAAAAFWNAGDVDIEQNRDDVLSTCTIGTESTGGAGPFAGDPLSCAVLGGSGSPKVHANSCSRIQQVAASGKNQITRQDQANVLFASVDGANNVAIEQGTFTGGIDSTQDQTSDGSTRSSIVDVQSADQIVSVKNLAPGGNLLITEVEDPRCCSLQTGSSSDTWSIGQRLNQRVFVEGELVDPGYFYGGTVAQRGAVYGQCTTTGTCTVNQRASNNADPGGETNSCSASGPPLASCDIFIECFAGTFPGPPVRNRAVGYRPAGRARVQYTGDGCFSGSGGGG